MQRPTTNEADEFVERLGQFFATNGLPRVAGRLLGHLLICDPSEQTFEQLVEAIGASRSSVSVASRLLIQLKLVERLGVRGQRRDRYRLVEDAWLAMLRHDIDAAHVLHGFAVSGLQLMASRSVQAQARLESMREFFSFLEDAYTPILAAWQQRVARPNPAHTRRRP